MDVPPAGTLYCPGVESGEGDVRMETRAKSVPGRIAATGEPTLMSSDDLRALAIALTIAAVIIVAIAGGVLVLLSTGALS